MLSEGHLSEDLRLGLSMPGSFWKPLSPSSVHRSLGSSPKLSGDIRPCAHTSFQGSMVSTTVSRRRPRLLNLLSTPFLEGLIADLTIITSPLYRQLSQAQRLDQTLRKAQETSLTCNTAARMRHLQVLPSYTFSRIQHHWAALAAGEWRKAGQHSGECRIHTPPASRVGRLRVTQLGR